MPTKNQRILKMVKIPDKVTVIDCESIDFPGKDIIVVKQWDDFLYMLGGCLVIFKLKGTYYNISNDVAYIYKEADK